MKPAWNNTGLSQGLSSGTFLSGKQWKDWDGKMIVSFMGIGIHGTPVGNRLDLLDISKDVHLCEAHYGIAADACGALPLSGSRAGW